jgi:phage gp36-like protein
MAYCTQADVQKEVGGSQRLIELTDDDRDGVADAAIITDAISRADALINSYVQRRESVPYASTPEIIRDKAVQETAYILKRRRRAVTDDDREQHEENIRWLEMFALGKVSAGEDPPPTKSSAVAAAMVERDSDEDISRSKLRGFW